jgi:very-short-patch-repair endonuclease
MENNFGQFYQDFIKNSLMPKEREDYNKALKTFKLTQEDFLEFIEDIIDNHFIEVDGEIHNIKENKEYDEVRDKYFEELDYKVLRFRNEEVESDVKRVLEEIKQHI